MLVAGLNPAKFSKIQPNLVKSRWDVVKSNEIQENLAKIQQKAEKSKIAT